ncbi:MAG: hypothetical protein KDD73_15900 [Anaerolineales bacterium]|nr:hypothetical protein [Anaerolineales bacterium]MCB9128776.1 hypothetical protein [Ardenticatenales bacterium]
MLHDVLAWPNLCDAWECIAENGGAPGADAMTVRRFARHWQQNLRRLQRLVAEERYRPGRLRRVAIPKRSGGWRRLAIANVGDRVLQRAVLNLLDDRCERLFLDCSYGYRQGRSLHDAVRRVVAWRDAGQRWLVDADIDDCFGAIPHGPLLDRLRPIADDAALLALIGQWLHQGRSAANPDRGLALGMPISPLLCNLYLHELDHRLTRRNRHIVRYADDFVICCSSPELAKRVQDEVTMILASMSLQIEPTKSRLTSFNEGFDFLGVHFEHELVSFEWQGKRQSFIGVAPAWLWSRMPHGYAS